MSASIDDIPGASKALNTIVAGLAKWQALPGRVQRISQQAAAVQTAGVAQQNQGVVQAMSLVQTQLATIIQMQQGSLSKLGGVTAFIAGLQAGTATINGGIIADAVSLAVTISSGLSSADAQEQQVASAATKVMTPAQMQSIGIGAPVPGGASATKWLVVALVTYVGWKAVRGRKRR